MQLRNRRGAFTVLTAILFLSLVGVAAVAVDFSRLWTLRNELQTAADAAAHAGAIQLSPGRFVNAQGVQDTARVYAQRNLAMGNVPVVDSLVLGNWDPNTRTFTAAGTPNNAIRVVTGYTMSGLLMRAFGVQAPRLRAWATGWSEAPVATTGCIKPWAVPYVALMLVINPVRGIPNTPQNLTRPWDQVNDVNALNSLTAAQRTFTLKLGSGGQNNPSNPGDTLGSAGNYQAVQLPKWYDAATQSYPTPGPVSGGSAYKDNISGKTCHGISVGDKLLTQTGALVGPTVQGVDKSNLQTAPYGICESLVNDFQSSTHGDCLNAQGGIGVDVKSAFYHCSSGCQGQSHVDVNLLGSFTLLKVMPSNCHNNNPMQCQAAEIRGVFKPIQAQGPVGGGSTTLQRPILTQ